MTFRKTACLASLLLSFPLAAPAVSFAGNWDVGADTDKTTGTAKESGESKENPHTETPDAATYEKIYIGHAERKGTEAGKAEANYNKGEIGTGVTVTQYLYGGSATTDKNTYGCNGIALEAKGNVLVLQDGSSVDGASGFNPTVYGGYAQSYTTNTGTADASENSVTIEKGASLKTAGQYYTNIIYGGYARLDYATGECSSTASDNNVTIKEGATFASNIGVYGGYAWTNNATGAVTASNNSLNIEKLADATTSYIKAGCANSNGKAAATASDNKAKLVFENVTLAKNVIGGHAHSEGGTAEANKNELTMTGGTFDNSDVWDQPRLYTAWAEGNGEVNASGNITNLTSVDHSSGVFAGGYATEIDSDSASNVHANSNNTTITDSKIYYVRGGYALDGAYAEAKGNTLTMSGGESYKIYAGQASITNYGDLDSQKKTYAWKNTLSLQNTASRFAYGGYATAENYDEEDDITVSKKEACAAENTLIVSGGSLGEAYAGCAESDNTAEATGNCVYLNYDPELKANSDTETVIYRVLFGGYAEGKNAKATGNTGKIVNAVFSGEDYGEFSGGFAMATAAGGSAAATGNIFEAEGGTYQYIYGGRTLSENGSTATSDSNKLTLTNVTVLKTIYGGCAESTVDTEADDTAVSGAASAKSNTLVLYGGKYSGDIYAGYASTTNSTAESGSNTIDLYALNNVSPSFSTSTVIWGGYASQGSTEVASTGNTLTFTDVKGMTAANIKNFQNLTFTYTEAQTLATNDVVLTLTGGDAKESTTIAGGTISVSVTSLKGEGDDPVFQKDDKVYLLKNANGLDISDEELSLLTKTATTAKKTGDGFLQCTVELRKNGTELYLTRTDSDPEPDDGDDDNPGDDDKPVTPDTPPDDDNPDTPDDGKPDTPDVDPITPDDDRHDDGKKEDAITAVPEAKAIAEGALAGLALVSESAEAVFEVMDEMAEQDLFTFGTVHAGNKTYESGSSITVSSVSLIAGLGKGFATQAGHLSVGAFFEYGKGSYTTSNSFRGRTDVDGDGSSWYMGGGVLAKMNFKDTGPGHFYVEGSAHMGTVHNEFDSSDFTDSFGNNAKFDLDSPYYSLHGGLGYVWNMTEGHELKVYGKYLWTMVQGTDETVATNAKYDFDDMHSNRIRAGVRYSYTGNERFKPYVGVAYEHEFAGSCDSTVFGYDVNSPSYEGSTGIGELGIAMTPSETLPLSFNLGVQGSVGKKHGVSGTFNAMYEF